MNDDWPVVVTYLENGATLKVLRANFVTLIIYILMTLKGSSSIYVLRNTVIERQWMSIVGTLQEFK